MKKALCLILAVLMALSLIGCGGPSAKDTVDNAMKALQIYDKEQIRTYWGNDSMFVLDTENESFHKMMQALLSGITYTTKSAEEDKSNATAVVTLDVTNTNFESLLTDAISAVVSYSMSYSLMSDTQPTEGELKTKLMDEITRLFNTGTYEKVTTSVNVNLSNVDGKWVIDNGDDICAAIMGSDGSDIFG